MDAKTDQHAGWEPVRYDDCGDDSVFTERLAVPGGWLYRVHAGDDIHVKTMSICFVPWCRYLPAELERM